MLQSQINGLTKEIQNLHEQKNQAEQYGRRSMLEICGIPVKDNEDCFSLLKNLLSLLELPESFIENIDIAHRV